MGLFSSEGTLNGGALLFGGGLSGAVSSGRIPFSGASLRAGPAADRLDGAGDPRHRRKIPGWMVREYIRPGIFVSSAPIFGSVCRLLRFLAEVWLEESRVPDARPRVMPALVRLFFVQTGEAPIPGGRAVPGLCHSRASALWKRKRRPGTLRADVTMTNLSGVGWWCTLPICALRPAWLIGVRLPPRR